MSLWFENMFAFAQRLTQRYHAAVVASPWRTKMATSALSFLCSDAIQQVSSSPAPSAARTRNHRTDATSTIQSTMSWDAARSARMCALGAVLHAPFIHVWLRAADRVFGAGFSWAKLLADQALAFPAFLGAFLAANEAVQALACTSTADAVAACVERKLRADFVDTYRTGLMLWPAAQLVNFRYVAPELRLLFMNATSLVVRLRIEQLFCCCCLGLLEIVTLSLTLNTRLGICFPRSLATVGRVPIVAGRTPAPRRVSRARTIFL